MSEAKTSTKRKVEPGDRFERWTVVREAVRGKSGHRHQWVRCDCGVERSVPCRALRAGRSKGCGCERLEVVTARATKHGKHKSPEYTAWRNIMNRCLNPNHPQFKDWGGRGITVVDEWRGLGGFERFFEHVGERPSDGHSIDRIDNDGDYRPGNVRWSTRSEQGRNKSNNRMLTHDGRTACVARWSEVTGIHQATITGRVNRGWSVERALTTPVNT